MKKLDSGLIAIIHTIQNKKIHRTCIFCSNSSTSFSYAGTFCSDSPTRNLRFEHQRFCGIAPISKSGMKFVFRNLDDLLFVLEF